MIDPTFEYVEAEERSSFRCVHRACDSFAGEHALHFHPAFELTWIIRSRGTRYVGDSVQRYAPGDLVLSGPNLPHCWREDADSEGPEWIIAQFDPACLGEGFLDLPEAAGLRKLLDDAARGAGFGPDAAAAVGPLLQALVSKTGLTRLVGLLEILDRLSCFGRTPLAAPDYLRGAAVDQKLIERLELVQRYIDEHLLEEISQGELAARLGLSASAFSKFFRAATGRTFMAQVKLLRINEACRLLANSDARITDVALEAGYRHTSHFDQHFHELKGMSPSEYRRRMRALASPGNFPLRTEQRACIGATAAGDN